MSHFGTCRLEHVTLVERWDDKRTSCGSYEKEELLSAVAREWTLQQGCREECLKIRKKSETHRPFSRLATAHVGWTGGILPYLNLLQAPFRCGLSLSCRRCAYVPSRAKLRTF